jgi:hypothetical protein
METDIRQTEKAARKISTPAGHPLDYDPHQALSQYAWLEFERDMWHFLTNPFADPVESKRQWIDQQEALDQLMNEGWAIVRPYPPAVSTEYGQKPKLLGYGLRRSVH